MSVLFVIFNVFISFNLVSYALKFQRKSITSNKFALSYEMRIRIQGTKNAYTTLRPFDVVLYDLQKSIEDSVQLKRLGVYTVDREVLPLCSYGEDRLYIDKTERALNAEKLNNDGRLCRIISSDRRGTESFIIEEYLGSEVIVPILNPLEPTIAGADLNADTANVAVVEVVSAPTVFPYDVDTLLTPDRHEHDGSDNELENLETELKYHEMKVAQCILKKQTLALQNTGKISSSTADNRNNKSVINSTSAPTAIGPYSQAIKMNGFLFVSGCIGINPVTNKLVDSLSIQSQTEQALKNLLAIINESGYSVSDVCKTTIMLADTTHFSIVNKIYGEFFATNAVGTAPPARSTFAVAALPIGALVEIEAIVGQSRAVDM